MKSYKCKFCNNITQKERENLKFFVCKVCKKSNKVISEIRPEVKTNLISDLFNDEDKPKKLDIKVENIKTDFIQTPEISERTTEEMKKEISEIETKEKYSEIKQKNFSKETISKYFETLDKMMEKKATKEVWDITKEEEILLGDVWSDYANEEFNKMSGKQSRLLIAGIATLTVYTPRIIDYIKKIIEKRNKKKEENKELKEETGETEIIEEDIPYENKRLVQNG